MAAILWNLVEIMGLHGPAKKPSALDRAEGHPGHRKPSSAEPVFPDNEPIAPADLSAAGLKVWNEIVPILLTVPGLVNPADSPVLGDFCEAHAQRLALQRSMQVEQKKRVAKEKAKAKAAGKRINVADEMAIALADLSTGKFGRALERARHRENQLRRELGLSPSARSSIRISEAENPGRRRDAEDVALFGRGPRLVAV